MLNESSRRNAAGGTPGTHRSASYLSPAGDRGEAQSARNANKSAAGKRTGKGAAKGSTKGITNCSSISDDNAAPVSKLTKSAKRKLRARAKRSVSFFLEHRQWLRQKAIEDLLTLARHGYLTPAIAAQAFTGKLTFMPAFEGLVIFDDNDLVQLERYEKVEGEFAGKASKSGMRKIWQSAYLGKLLPKEQYSETVRLVVRDPLEFMWFVQKKVAEWDQAERSRHQLDKVMPRGRKQAKPQPQAGSLAKKKPTESGAPILVSRSVIIDINNYNYLRFRPRPAAGYRTWRSFRARIRSPSTARSR